MHRETNQKRIVPSALNSPRSINGALDPIVCQSVRSEYSRQVSGLVQLDCSTLLPKWCWQSWTVVPGKNTRA